MNVFVYVKFKLNWAPIFLCNLAAVFGDPRETQWASSVGPQECLQDTQGREGSVEGGQAPWHGCIQTGCQSATPRCPGRIWLKSPGPKDALEHSKKEAYYFLGLG